MKKNWEFVHSKGYTAKQEIIDDIRQFAEEEQAVQKALHDMASDTSALDRQQAREAEDSMIHNTAVNVLAGYDNRYMSRNDYRVAYKTRNAQTQRNDDSYWDYLFRCATPQPKVKCSVRKVKALPKASYIPEVPTVLPNAKSKGYKAVGDMVYIRGYHIYREAIFLEVERLFDVNTRKYRREREEANTFYYVFFYKPFKWNGQPNENCGFNQISKLLKGIGSITESGATTLEEMLNASIGCLVELDDSVPTYEYCTDITITCQSSDYLDRFGEMQKVFKKTCDFHDNHEVVRFYGDIQYFDDVFSPLYFDDVATPIIRNNRGYESVTEFFAETTEEEREWIDEYESLDTEIYADISTKISNVISYDCHKEFKQELPLLYSHIGYIFD